MPISDQINNIAFFQGGGGRGVQPTDFFGLSADMFVQLKHIHNLATNNMA